MSRLEKFLRKNEVIPQLQQLRGTFDESVTPVELAAVLLSYVDKADEIFDERYFKKLCEDWGVFLANSRGRYFLRTMITDYYKSAAADTRAGYTSRIDSLVYNVSRQAQQTMRSNCPDIFYAIYAASLPSIDLVLLNDIEYTYQLQYCRRTPPQDNFINESILAALEIDFFERAWAMNLRWNLYYHDRIDECEWAIPPQARQTSSLWYVPRKIFEQRLEWIFPGIIQFLQSIRHLNIRLSGSCIPLCILKHEQYTERQHDFESFANEVYKNYALDFFACINEPMTSAKFRSVSDLLCSNFVNFFLASFYPNLEWKVTKTLQWVEDDDSWAMRNRRGVTYYIVSNVGSQVRSRVQLIVLYNCSLQEAITQQHLPCVRASYDGQTLFVTASCYISWMTRFIFNRPLFGALIDQQRKSKTVFKYATRGWGYSTQSIDNLQLPSTLVMWLQDWEHHRKLPYYHPLYNPLSWHKWMTEDRVKNLMECVDD